MTTNSQYHWREYKRKDYGPLKEYKLNHKPKYHEYKSYHEYGKAKEYDRIRNYEHREYKPIKPNYNGYRPEARPQKEKKPMLPRREKQYNRQVWFRQLKHCYKLPMGPEYPVRPYKLREYKRKKDKLDYHEYKGYKPFKGYPEYKGGVYYKLTPLNYYGFRRGKRVFRPVTPDPYPIPPAREPIYPQQTLIKPTEEIIEPEPQAYEPLAPASEIVYPQQVLIKPMTPMPILKEKPEYKQTIRDDNGVYKLQHPVGYHPYNSYHEYDSPYRPYQYKPYNHLFLYTAKDSPDQKPHIVRKEKDIKHIYYQDPPTVVPLQQAPPSKPWKQIYANEPILPQQTLIMPTPVVKPRKNIPNQKEPVYPQQTLIKPLTIIPAQAITEDEPDTVVQREEVRAVHRAARIGPVLAPVIFQEEESPIIYAPVAPVAPRYVPTSQTYIEPESQILTAPPNVKPLPPVETIEQRARDSPKAVKVIPVPLVASAPPPPKYKPTSVAYKEESKTIIMPKSAIPKPRQVTPTPAKIDDTAPAEPKTRTPEPVVKHNNYTTAPIVPITVAASSTQLSKSPKFKPVAVAVESKPDAQPVQVKSTVQAESNPVINPPEPNPIPVPVVAAAAPPKEKTKSPQNKPIPIPIPVPVPQSVPNAKQEPANQQSKPKPSMGPIPVIPEFKNETEAKSNPKPDPVESTPPPKQKYLAQPVLPPQPRKAPPTTKPPPKPVESKPEPVESKPEPEPEPEDEEPKTPPKQRAPIRRPSLPPAPSPPLDIPKPQAPTSKAPAPALAVPKLDRDALGALGSVKRTMLMMG